MTTDEEPKQYVDCPICGGYSAVTGEWNSNTCSPDCARTAAIVEAVRCTVVDVLHLLEHHFPVRHIEPQPPYHRPYVNPSLDCPMSSSLAHWTPNDGR